MPGCEGACPRDLYAMLFCRVDPKRIPESGSWWKARQTELMTVRDDHELEPMTSVVTITLNDLAPELIAHARRGPCAVPSQEEKLFTFSPGELPVTDGPTSKKIPRQRSCPISGECCS